MGKNPYHLIAKKRKEAAHFREYTIGELTRYCRHAGFSIEEKIIKNYFDYRYRNHAFGPTNYSPKTNKYQLLNLLFSIVPASLRPGLCIVVRAK